MEYSRFGDWEMIDLWTPLQMGTRFYILMAMIHALSCSEPASKIILVIADALGKVVSLISP